MEYKGLERRAEERTGELSEDQVRKAAGRLIESGAHIDELEFSEGDVIKGKIKKMVMGRVENKEQSEMGNDRVDIPALLLDACKYSFVGLSRDGIIDKAYRPVREGDKSMPEYQELLDFLLKTLTEEQIEILNDPRYISQLGIQIVPIMNTWRALEAVNHDMQSIELYEDGEIGWTDQTILERDKRNGLMDSGGKVSRNIIGWKIWLGETKAVPVFLTGENTGAFLGTRQKWLRKNFSEHGFDGITLDVYLRLMADSLAGDKPIDNVRKFHATTLLSGEEARDFSPSSRRGNNCRLPIGWWDERTQEFALKWEAAEFPNKARRHRLSLVLELPENETIDS
jgi:hypothetical protein